jgi:hypothetical protein
MFMQEDLFTNFDLSTETKEGMVTTTARGANLKLEIHDEDENKPRVSVTSMDMPPAKAGQHPQDPINDAREYANKFWPRMLDPHPSVVAMPPAEDNLLADDAQRGEFENIGGLHSQARPRQPMPYQHVAATETLVDHVNSNAGLPHPPPPPPIHPTSASSAPLQLDLDLPPLPPNRPVPAYSSPSMTATDTTTTAAMDTLREAMATASSIAKLGASEALKDPAAILKSWDRAMAAGRGTGNSKELQSALEKVVRDVASAGGRGTGGAMSVGDLERDGVVERLGEARREALEWERRFNKAVRGNRKAALGHN